MLPVPVPDFGFVNLYGTDVTAAKVVARFPDRNPNPVLRVSEEGVLVYANDASRQMTWTFGCEIGQPLPDEYRAKVVGGARRQRAAILRGPERRSDVLLLPVLIPEFGFINLYGTDITARKAIDRFPDQNPNPVLRVSRAPGSSSMRTPPAADRPTALGSGGRRAGARRRCSRPHRRTACRPIQPRRLR